MTFDSHGERQPPAVRRDRRLGEHARRPSTSAVPTRRPDLADDRVEVDPVAPVGEVADLARLTSASTCMYLGSRTSGSRSSRPAELPAGNRQAEQGKLVPLVPAVIVRNDHRPLARQVPAGARAGQGRQRDVLAPSGRISMSWVEPESSLPASIRPVGIQVECPVQTDVEQPVEVKRHNGTLSHPSGRTGIPAARRGFCEPGVRRRPGRDPPERRARSRPTATGRAGTSRARPHGAAMRATMPAAVAEMAARHIRRGRRRSPPRAIIQTPIRCRCTPTS